MNQKAAVALTLPVDSHHAAVTGGVIMLVRCLVVLAGAWYRAVATSLGRT